MQQIWRFQFQAAVKLRVSLSYQIQDQHLKWPSDNPKLFPGTVFWTKLRHSYIEIFIIQITEVKLQDGKTTAKPPMMHVHRSICLELHRLIDRILHVILAIESARPNCMLAVQALCSLNFTLAEAKSIIKHCSKCSKLYLISAILHDLRGTEFSLEFAEDEARKVLLSLLEKNFPDSASVQKEELEAIQIATSRLEIKSPFSLLVEKATLKKQLEEVSEENLKQKELLQYLLYLLVKHGKSNCQFQNGSHSPKHECHDQSLEHELVVDESSQ
ncbi:uncharacterized protein [Glycine max]|uniref:uncharacterized protein isoform X2 n=1 Tax=Glycine max TaxID=3847 RepID=UPI001B35700A|nr:uncharacterized protein LOC100796783 isoform X2 [Glycine max]